MIARIRSAFVAASDSPKKTPRAALSQMGERSPYMYGRKINPLAPAELRAASWLSRSNGSRPNNGPANRSASPS